MSWCCPATSAHDVYTQIARKVCEILRERLRCFFEDRVTAHVLGNAGVRNHRHWKLRILAKIANVLGHLLWAGCAIHAENVDRKWLEGGVGRSDLRSHEHRAECFDGDLCNHRHAPL